MALAMWYKIDWRIFAIQMLPLKRRRKSTIEFLKILIRQIEFVYDKWQPWRLENIYKIYHTGQVCFLRKALNDSCDTVLRRIYISDGQQYDTFYIYTEAEAQDRFMNVESEDNTIWLRTESETADTGLDFIVWVPHDVFNTQIYKLTALIEFYKAGGKRYSIFIINE